jgi:small neutral amino acid transporter SnatA (MarC family)
MSPAVDLPDVFVSVFVTLFVVIDPPGYVFAGLASAVASRAARYVAIQACVIA